MLAMELTSGYARRRSRGAEKKARQRGRGVGTSDALGARSGAKRFPLSSGAGTNRRRARARGRGAPSAPSLNGIPARDTCRHSDK